MILPPPKRPRSTEDNILPLINIVFLLLIFFMLAGVLTQKPPFELAPPSTSKTENSAQLAQRVLSVSSDGELAMDGERLSEDMLAQTLDEWPQGQPLQIRADGQLKAKALTGLFSSLRRAGITEVNLLTRHNES